MLHGWGRLLGQVLPLNFVQPILETYTREYHLELSYAVDGGDCGYRTDICLVILVGVLYLTIFRI